MFDSFLETLFSDVYETAILMGDTVYIPLETGISTLLSLVIYYGVCFGVASWIGCKLLDLFQWLYLECRYRWSLRQKFDVTDK